MQSSSCDSRQEIRKVNADKATKARIRRRRTKKGRKANEGMTAAIILIAFIITAAGVAFVILTMGSTLQQQLSATGQQALQQASSAMQVEGGLVVGYDADGDNKLEGLVWNMRLVLGTGEVDLSESAIEVSVFIGNLNESRLTYNQYLNSEAYFWNSTAANNTYGMVFYDEVHTNQILDAGEIVRFFVLLDANTHQIAGNDNVMIILISSVAMMKVSKVAPTGIEAGMNLLR